MKKLIITTIFILSISLQAQDWSSVYRQIEEVTLNEGLDNEYVAFEGFWKTIKEKQPTAIPEIDKNFLNDEKINLVIQINGRKREVLELEKNTNEDTIMKLIEKNEKLENYIKNKKIIKKILVPNKIINLIIK